MELVELSREIKTDRRCYINHLKLSGEYLSARSDTKHSAICPRSVFMYSV